MDADIEIAQIVVVRDSIDARNSNRERISTGQSFQDEFGKYTDLTKAVLSPSRFSSAIPPFCAVLRGLWIFESGETLELEIPPRLVKELKKLAV